MNPIDELVKAAEAWDANLSEYCDGPERDALRNAIPAAQAYAERMGEVVREMYDAMVRYQMDAEGDPPYTHRAMMHRAEALLASLDAPSGTAKETNDDA